MSVSPLLRNEDVLCLAVILVFNLFAFLTFSIFFFICLNHFNRELCPIPFMCVKLLEQIQKLFQKL